jgi:transcription elongation factor GreA
MDQISYLTEKGAKELRAELERLKGPARQEISKRLRSAIEMGDLSENADYITAKEEQGFLEGRIKELDAVLSNVVIIDELKSDTNTVNIGNTVVFTEDDFPPEEYQMVGPKEADPANGRISHESPIGKALLGRRVGDTVKVSSPNGQYEIKIVKIK